MARRKITAETAQAAAELPELTDKQHKFVEGLLAGKTGADAYRAAFDCSTMLSSTVIAAASRLRADSKIAAWLSAGRQAHLGSATVTFENHIRELERLKEIAIASGNVGAAVQAEQIRGKAAGHHVDQIRDVTERHDPVETIRQIADLTGVPAHIVAAKHGIEWPATDSETRH